MGNYQAVKDYRKRVKERLVYVFGGKCQICGYDRCVQVLEFHHLNPEEKEFSISNSNIHNWEKMKEESKKCVLICANCHREIHAGFLTIENLVSGYNEERAIEITKLVEELKTGTKKYCRDCGAIIDRHAERCKKCSNINRRKVERPDRELLKYKIRNQTFVSVAREYGVVDNTIRKWCKTYNLPHRKKDIDFYSDEEWIKI